MKFLRTYSMLAEGRDGTIASGNPHILTFPLTCRFNVINDNTFTYGTATFLLYNLSASTRADLYKDAYQLSEYKKIVFSAGYLDDPVKPVVIFQGNISLCYSYRQGADWITEIQAMDGAHAGDTATVDVTLGAGYSFSYVVNQLARAMSPTIAIGRIGKINGTGEAKVRSITLSGNPMDLMIRLCNPLGILAYIYQEKFYAVTSNEYIAVAGGVTQISQYTGMVGSPKLGQFIVTVDMLFEPRIQVQQNIELVTYLKPMSQVYLVSRVNHRGTISGAVCEDLKTSVTLLRPSDMPVATAPGVGLAA